MLRAQLIHPQARDLQLRANPHGDGLRLGLSAGAAVGKPGAGFYGHLAPAKPAFGLLLITGACRFALTGVYQGSLGGGPVVATMAGWIGLPLAVFSLYGAWR